MSAGSTRRACLAALLGLLHRGARASVFVPDTDPDRIPWFQLDKVLGPAPNVRGRRFGVVLKTMTNEYWRLMAAGYRRRAALNGAKLDIQAAQSESDATRQLAMMQNMVGSRYAGLLISPQSESNLQPAIDDAALAKIPVVDVDGAVVDNVQHFVGAMNREMGIKVGQWFIANARDGGAVAVIEGLPGVFSSVHRTAGFRDTLLASTKFQIVASVSGRWEEQRSFDLAVDILRKTPALIGFYCNNDTMALGVVEAVKSLKLASRVKVFGTDGIQAAYKSIRAGELTGTVDIFPMLTADIGMDVVERLTVGQRVPRVVETPQALVTLANVDRYSGSFEQMRKALLEDVGVGR